MEKCGTDGHFKVRDGDDRCSKVRADDGRHFMVRADGVRRVKRTGPENRARDEKRLRTIERYRAFSGPMLRRFTYAKAHTFTYQKVYGDRNYAFSPAMQKLRADMIRVRLQQRSFMDCVMEHNNPAVAESAWRLHFAEDPVTGETFKGRSLPEDQPWQFYPLPVPMDQIPVDPIDITVDAQRHCCSS